MITEREVLENVSKGRCPEGESCDSPQTVVSCIFCWRRKRSSCCVIGKKVEGNVQL